MSDSLESFFATIASVWSQRFWDLLSYPFDPNQRLYWLYALTTACFALLVYRKTWREDDKDRPSFLAFLFPKKVWKTSSAWLDLRFFIVNELTMKFLYLGLLAATLALTFRVLTGSSEFISLDWKELWTAKGLAITFGCMLVAAAVADFIAFFVHYLQHKIPFLWEFHKVHHSPEVMHPLSNFREHPVDNIAYSVAIGLGYGALMAAIAKTFGYIPRAPEVFGTTFFFFAFNAFGYHLRHSHIWLRWKGRWSMVFPSPAHHHVHHSCHPDHLDKNFAFMLPIWDVIFRTYEMPEDDRDVIFGIYGAKEQEYTSIWKIYALPFKKLWKRWKKRRMASRTPAE